jgi:hypothetical protein
MMTLAKFEAARARAEAALRRPARLFEIRLPAGDHKTINVGGSDGGTNELDLNPQSWLSQGYEGVRIIGHANGTTVRATAYDGVALKVVQHSGIVQFENLNAVAGHTRATSFGMQPKTELGERKHPLYPKFLVRWYGGSVLVPPPSELGGKRSKWGIFGYQFDSHFADLVIDATYAAEHAMYGHNVAHWGRLNERVRVAGAGAEALKERGDAIETDYAGPQAFIIDRRVVMLNWFMEWSDRGGAGRNLQGTPVNYYAEDCEARNTGNLGHVLAHQRGKGWMLSSEGESFDFLTGQVDKAGGYGLGYVLLRRSVSAGFSDVGWGSQAIRVGVNGGRMGSALGVWLDGCGAFGANRTVELTGVKSGGTLVSGCNTPAIREWCENKGIDTRFEATIPTATRRIPLWEGFKR